MRGLSTKQNQFCLEYIKDLNATQAAIRAGYAKASANIQGSKLLTNPNVKKRIDELLAERVERTKVDAEVVLRDLDAVRRMDVADIMADDGTLLPVKQWPEVWRRYIVAMDVSEINVGEGEPVAVLKKIKIPDKLKNLELLGKHVAVMAFKDSIDHNHKGEVRTITRRIVDTPDGRS